MSHSRIVQYLWDKLGSRTSDMTTFVPRGMVEELFDLLPEELRLEGSQEDAVISYLEHMASPNVPEYQGTRGDRFRITMQPRADWPTGHLGFRVDRLN